LIFGSALAPSDRALLALRRSFGIGGRAARVYQAFTGRPFDPYLLDSMEAARVLHRHGRHAQAQALLLRALIEEPGHSDGLQCVIDATTRKRQV
jgi:hypothetical protein